MLRPLTLTQALSVTATVGLIAACGATPSSGGTTPLAQRDLCPAANEVRLGRLCWDPTGSRWHVRAQAPGGEYTFDVVLLPGNRLRATDHPAASTATDEWFVEQGTVRLFLANRFVEYHADMTNGTVIIGQATNAQGESWDWRGDRVQGTGSCERNEATLQGVCVTVAGTRWLLRDGQDRTIQFAADGHLLIDGAAPSESDHWSQEGANVRFTIGGREYAAQIGDTTLSLRGDGWATEAVPSYPPPMH